MSLYLKYRPQHFGDVVGQSHITDILLAQSAAGTFSHNYLLYGPRGTGKTTTARLIAKLANATTDDLTTDPIAKLIDAWHTLDFVEIDAASHTWVDNIREEIIDKALYPPSQLKKKVYVIDEVHMLSKGAFNALLKIMEEPPAYLLFVLATTEINKVPDTIVSRCQIFNFKRIGIDPIVGRLTYIAEQEWIEYEDEWLRLIAKLSSGALRDAIKFLEQVSMLGKVTAAHVAKFLWVVSDTIIEEFVWHLVEKNEEKLYISLDELYASGTDLVNFTKDLLLRLDEHFMENPAVYSQLAQVCTWVYSQIKRYPYPVLVYKSSLYTYIHQAQGPVPVVKKTPATKPVIVASKKAESVPVAVVSTVVSSPKETLEVPTTQTAISGDASHDEIMQAIIAKVEKKMIASILKQHTMITKANEEMIEAVVVNQQYFNMIQKTEIVSYLQDIVSEVRGMPTQIKFTYMTKEDYLQQALS